MDSHQLCVIGGGGRVMATVLGNICKFEQGEIEGIEIDIYDLDLGAAEETTAFVKGLCQRTGRRYTVRVCRDLEAGLRGAHVVLIGTAARVRSGLGYLDDIENVLSTLANAPIREDAWILNAANPAGLLTSCIAEARPQTKVAGICTGSEEFRQNIARLLEVPPTRVQIEYCGTNHHGFVLGLTVDGQDVLPELRRMATTFSPHDFQGLRPGDEYDLLATLDLFTASGVLTIPLGHDPYLHGTRCYRREAKEARRRPDKAELIRLAECEASMERVWTGLDSWGGISVAGAVLNLMGRRHDVVNLQLPNEGLLPEAPNDAYVEAPARAGPMSIERIRLDIPSDIRLHVAHCAMYTQALARGLVRGDGVQIVRALMLKGQTRNFRRSLTEIRSVLAGIGGIQQPTNRVYEPPREEELAAVFGDEREMNFLFI